MMLTTATNGNTNRSNLLDVKSSHVTPSLLNPLQASTLPSTVHSVTVLLLFDSINHLPYISQVMSSQSVLNNYSVSQANIYAILDVT